MIFDTLKFLRTLGFLLLLVGSVSAFTKSSTSPEGRAANGAQGDIQFAHGTIQVGAKNVRVEIADSSEKLSRGLMHRRSMPTDEGMIFIFDDEETRAFWMKNTFIPLSIAYIDSKGVIVDIQDMSPVKSEMETQPPSYASARPAQYALEMNQGWYSRNKIKVGDRVNLSHLVQKKNAK